MHGFVDAQAEGPLFQMDEHGQLIAIHGDNGNASHIPVQPRGVRPSLVADQVPLAQHEGIPCSFVNKLFVLWGKRIIFFLTSGGLHFSALSCVRSFIRDVI